MLTGNERDNTPVVNPTSGGVPATLRPNHSLLCMEVPDSSMEDGVPVIQSECDSGTNQSFSIRDAEQGLSYIIPTHSGKCLQVARDSTNIGERIIQGGCDNKPSALWRINTIADGISISNNHSGLCLGVENRSREPGTVIHQWPCNGRDNQSFLSGSRSPNSNQEANSNNSISFSTNNAIWSDIKPMPLIPAASANLRNGKVLLWSSYKRYDFYGDGRKTETTIYDPVTDTTSELLVRNTEHDMFCPGVANLPDGRILVSGGSSDGATSIYNPDNDSWEKAPDMNIGRGYHSNVTLNNGDVFTLGGSWSGGTGDKSAEIFRNGQWDPLDGVTTIPSIVTADFRGLFRGDNHMWLFAWENGKIFQAGPSKTMHWIDTAGNGAITVAGRRGADTDAMNGNAVMYDIGKILTVGGSLDYDASAASTNTHVIDINNNNVSARRVQSIKRERVFHNSVVLPSGEVIVFGGHNYARAFSDRDSVLVPEIFNPVTETWSDLPAMQVPRNYHSVALLLPDGRVMNGGGGLCGDCDTNHPDIEILTPPYLLDENQNLKPRPQITDAPVNVNHGETINVATTDGAREFVLLRSSNSTHSVNNAQRRVPLQSRAVNSEYSRVIIPNNSGILPPGDYMLFAIDASGTPSVAHQISVQ